MIDSSAIFVPLSATAHAVRAVPLTMGAEDFSFFLRERAGCYFLIGNGHGSHRSDDHGTGPGMLHSYDFNDELIPLGAKVWSRLVDEWYRMSRDSG